MKELHHNIFRLAIFLMGLLFFKPTFPFTSAIIILFLWFFSTKDYSIMLVFLLILYFLYPPIISHDLHDSYRVSHISRNYVVLKHGKQKILYYTTEAIPFDTEVKVNGTLEPISSELGFYTFHFKTYCEQEGIYDALIGSITITKQTTSLRGRLFQAIQTIRDEEAQKLLNEVLLGIHQDNEGVGTFLNDTGFRFTGFLYLLRKLLHRLKKPRMEQYLFTFIYFLCMVFFHFKLLFVQGFLYQFFRCLPWKGHQRLGYTIIVTLLFYPFAIYRISFLFPTILRICNIFFPNQKTLRFYVLTILQCLYYQECNPILLLLYPTIAPIYGGLYIFMWLYLLFQIPYAFVFHTMDILFSFLQRFTIYGNIIGVGIIFYICFVYMIRKKPTKYAISLVLLFVFLHFGLFHPCAEVSFINVGQGDAILLRAPFNQENILIDTGKPEKKKTLESYLHALGIHTIDTLIITHNDNDHSGNKEYIMQSYQVNQYLDRHQKQFKTTYFTIYDLNEIQNENENQSSLVSLFYLNGLTYLCMGDADTVVEEQILQTYGNLSVDILKLGHHGSKTSTSNSFLEGIRPKLGIISCGNYAIYHHPSNEVLQNLVFHRIPFLITKEDGDIRICAIWGMNLCITASGKIAIIK